MKDLKKNLEHLDIFAKTWSLLSHPVYLDSVVAQITKAGILIMRFLYHPKQKDQVI